MKITIVFTLILLSSIVVKSESPDRALIDKIIFYCDGVIKMEGYTQCHILKNRQNINILVSLPSHYTFELFQSKVRHLINKNDNIRIITHWRESDEYYFLQLVIQGRYYVRIFYFLERPLVEFSYNKSELDIILRQYRSK